MKLFSCVALSVENIFCKATSIHNLKKKRGAISEISETLFSCFQAYESAAENESLLTDNIKIQRTIRFFYIPVVPWRRNKDSIIND